KATFQKIKKARLLRRFLFPLPPFLPVPWDKRAPSDARRLWRAVLEQFVHEMKSRQAVNQLGVKETVLFLFGVAVIGREQVGTYDFRLIRGLPFDDLFLAELLREFLGVLRRQAAKGDLVAASGHDGPFDRLCAELSAFHLKLAEGLGGEDAGHPVFGGDVQEAFKVRVDVPAEFVHNKE